VTPPATILIATKNRGKLREVQDILAGLPVVLTTLDQFPNLPDAVEDADTFAVNAERKAMHYARLTDLWTLADDSGLEVDALDGAPGACRRNSVPHGSGAPLPWPVLKEFWLRRVGRSRA
jgi:inosine/xanthosine triphosphate pyrophosphatase family protein